MKWITDLNERAKPIKILEENRKKPSDLGLGKDFLDKIPKAKSIKENIGKLDFIKIKNFCSMKDIVKENEKTSYGLEENICKSPI